MHNDWPTHASLNLLNLGSDHDVGLGVGAELGVGLCRLDNLRVEADNRADGDREAEGDLVKGEEAEGLLGKDGDVGEAELKGLGVGQQST
jgi:hypothetical protein